MPARTGYNKGISPKKLFYKHRIDTWGHFLTKKKFNHRATQRILTLFELNLRWSTIKLLRPFRFRFNREWNKYKRHKRWFKPFIKFGAKKKKPVSVYKNETARGHSPRPAFFSSLFKYYTIYKNYDKPQNFLVGVWRIAQLARLRFKTPSFLYYVNFKRRRAFLTRPYIPRRSETVERKLTILRLHQFFCFPTINQTKNFLQRQEFNFYRRTKDCAFLGMEGNILNLIFKTSLFPTTRFGYILVKIGAVLVNDIPLSSPHKTIQLFDTFRFQSSFIKTIFYYFKKRLRRRLIIFGVPKFISYNYKLMSFKIWRLPNDSERKFLRAYPYWHKPIDTHLLPATPDAFMDPDLD